MNKERQTEYLLMDNTFQGVRRAMELAGQGKDVILAVEETYLAADICGRCLYRRQETVEGFFPQECFGGDVMIPDRCKQYLEERCMEAGVKFYYGLYFVEEASGQCDEDSDLDLRVVSLAGKGGLISVVCRHVERHQEEEDLNGRLSLRTWVRDARDGSCGLVEAAVNCNREKSPAENLLMLRRELLAEFQRKRKNHPPLVLGRFADCWSGRLGAGSMTETVDVIVAGGGTAGAMAALYAARGGARTLLLEPMYDLGGTSTLGGVNAYWFGTSFADTKEVDEMVDRLCESCGIERPAGMFGKYDAFHGGIKGLVLLELCLRAGVEVCFGRLAYDVIREKGRIAGVKCAGKRGKEVCYGRLVIDATGDGDLAAAAGADIIYGADRDGFTYWGSLAQYSGPDSYRNNFSSMVRLDDVEDFTDFIITGRRRGGWNLFDHGSYVSVRESRHIRGERVIGLKDVCLLRTYEDGIYTCFSNYDPKGKLDADSVYCGYLVPQMKMQVPLRACLPVDGEGKRIEGLMMAGKAISANHNAFPGLRMQRDLMHQGAVLGLLAAKAVLAGTDVEKLPMEQCRRWIEKETGDSLTLPHEKNFVSLREAAALIAKGERIHWIDVSFAYEEKKVSPLLALVYGEREEALCAIRERIGKTEETEVLLTLKKLALFHGADEYTEEIEDHILRQLSESEPFLPERKGSCMCAQLLPDHGVMPEVVYELNLLSHGKSFSMKPYELVTARLAEGERDYEAIRKGIFTYIESVAYAGEHSKRKEFIPLLCRLIKLPEFKEAFADENKIALMSQRWQILWVILNRTLLLLGSREGQKGLESARKSSSAAIRIGAEKALAEGMKRQGEEKGRIIRQ
ncbi:MAG: FAD-dependent oxidoreductase [Lachnospiraceae bacterium]|nr:FAD-dependent oxidoreductase [Lachnospiraceae bacterium]